MLSRGLLPIIVAVVAACYAPQPQPGSPCDDEHPCPSALFCSPITSTCESELGTPDATPVDTSVPGCEPSGFDECGDGIDQDCSGGDAICVDNDAPDGAIDVTSGGTFTSDLRLATDDLPQRGCGDDGGRDVFYRVTLTAPEVVYFDTFGSNFDTTLRVFPGKACTQLAGGSGAACSDDACDDAASQLAVRLPSGTSCIVVDRNAGSLEGTLSLTVTRGGRDGMALAPMVSGDTCTATDVWAPPSDCADSGAKDLAYWFAVCPNTTARVSATTCSSATSYTFDTVLYLRKAGEAQALACSDDDASCPARPTRPDHADGSKLADEGIAGPGLGWLVVDGYTAGNCGAFTLTDMIR